jgi:hypothetical protein
VTIEAWLESGRPADDLEVVARTVLAQDPYPSNYLDVTIALEVSGYTSDHSARLGSPDLFHLAHRILSTLQESGYRVQTGALPGASPFPRRPRWQLLTWGLAYNVPWIAALVALFVGRVSFWSTITTTQFSSTISLALFLALVVTGAFVQAFARRATFYALQGNVPLVMWSARRFLGAGALTATVVSFACYWLLERGLRAYTPASNQLFLAYSIAISLLLLSLAPLYMTRRFGAMGIASASGAVFLVVSAHLLTVGNYLNTYTAMRLGLSGISVLVLIAAPLAYRALRDAPREWTATAASVSRRVARYPRGQAVVSSVAAYAFYGAGFFAMLISDQLVAGGLWHGRYQYSGRYELAVASALLVLIPVLAYVIAVQERFPEAVQYSLSHLQMTELQSLRSDMTAFFNRHFVRLAALSFAVGSGLVVLLWILSRFAGTGRSIPDIRPVMGTFVIAILAYVLLSAGALSSGLLFALGRPRIPASATAAGAATSLLLGGLLSAVLDLPQAPVCGLVVGTAVFAAVTTRSAAVAFRDFDAVYYGAF